MRKIAYVDFSVLPVVEAAIRVITDADIVQRLWNSKDDMDVSEKNYVAHALSERLYLIPLAEVVGFMTQAEMSKVYDGTFVRKGSFLRSNFYDLIIASAPHGVCPSCNQRTVSTLDHYLPKKHHPALAITPINLVPSCGDCNKIKLAYGAQCAGDQLLHPYFDDVEDGVWLHARVVEGDPPSLAYFVDPPEGWSPEKKERVSKHFSVLGLEKLFVAHGSRLISDIGTLMSKLLNEGGPGVVSDHLMEQAFTRRNPIRQMPAKNSWQIAAYVAMSESAYFCSYIH